MEERAEGISYIPDIDGLRAIAVISVIFFHISFGLVPGGFAGVDIFFVISGFLITKIIAMEILESRFSFKAFYIRRIRRILPVFFLVIAVTMIVGAILLLPQDLTSLLKSIQYALLFSANIYFSKEQGYFDIASDEKPILHLWSLSIEEQYYFIWPLLLIILFAIGHKISNQRKNFKLAFVVLCTAALISGGFILTQKALESSGTPDNLYFLLQTRFGELMIGSLVALLPLVRQRHVSNMLGIVGLVSVLLALFIIDKNDLFPGYNALLPCLGAALLLYASQSGEFKTGFVSRFLRLPPLVYLGLLSYSLYLWHWPILAYMRYVYGSYTLPWQWNIAALVLTLALSWLSYTFLEKKTKRTSMNFKTALISVYAIPCALLLILSFIGAKASIKVQLNQDLTTYGTDVCHGSFDKKCVRGAAGKQPTILMFGDSHAAALNSFIDVVGNNEQWSAMVVTASSCSPVFGFDEMALPDFARKPCADLKNYVVNNYRKYDAVFIASYWEYQLGWTGESTDKAYLKKFQNTIESIAKSTPVYVFSDVLRLPVSPARLLHFEKLRLNVDRGLPEKTIAANDAVKKIVLSVPNAHWIDITPALKDFGTYKIYQGLPTYLDDHHLNKYGSTKLGEVWSGTTKIMH